jgi:glucose-6-phosphate isomerase
MKLLKLDCQYTKDFISDNLIEELKEKSVNSIIMLEKGTGKGNEFTGWTNTPYSTEYIEIQKIANEFRNRFETVVVIGIGGSYLGSRAVITSLENSFQKQKPEILYAGNNLCEYYHSELLQYLEDKNFGIIVISKSGTTTEPAIAFRLIKELAENKYGKTEASSRIIAITDKSKGALKKLAETENYRTFNIPDDVGGRFSVLTPVGLLPIAIAGFNIFELLKGAQEIDNHSTSAIPFDRNIVLKYAVLRNALYNLGKKIEILTCYTPKLFFIIEWWKQLYGESEGKQGKGIFPAGIVNTTDLHSLGQYVQDGERHVFETILSVATSNINLNINKNEENLDGLNYLDGKTMFEVNQKAQLGTILAHKDGNVPNIVIEISEINEFNIGQLIMFFEKACAVSAYMSDVNPFDQPGVEQYKSNMFKLLGKI